VLSLEIQATASKGTLPNIYEEPHSL